MDTLQTNLKLPNQKSDSSTSPISFAKSANRIIQHLQSYKPEPNFKSFLTGGGSGGSSNSNGNQEEGEEEGEEENSPWGSQASPKYGSLPRK